FYYEMMKVEKYKNGKKKNEICVVESIPAHISENNVCWMSIHIRKHRIKNECIGEKVVVAPIVEKMIVSYLRFWACLEKTIRSPNKESRAN
ncbi:hypothetical protein Lal_00011370, partial [Lupinus albus]